MCMRGEDCGVCKLRMTRCKSCVDSPNEVLHFWNFLWRPAGRCHCITTETVITFCSDREKWACVSVESPNESYRSTIYSGVVSETGLCPKQFDWFKGITFDILYVPKGLTPAFSKEIYKFGCNNLWAKQTLPRHSLFWLFLFFFYHQIGHFNKQLIYFQLPFTLPQFYLIDLSDTNMDRHFDCKD